MKLNGGRFQLGSVKTQEINAATDYGTQCHLTITQINVNKLRVTISDDVILAVYQDEELAPPFLQNKR